MIIKEKSKITLEVDGAIVDRTFHDSNDAWEKAVNRIMQGATGTTMTEVMTIESLGSLS